MRLLAFVPKPIGVAPSQRFRLEQWAPHLSAHDVHLTFSVYESPELTRLLYLPRQTVRKALALAHDTWRCRDIVERARGFDGVIVHREISVLGRAYFERQLAKARIPFVYDFDDAIWMRGAGGANGGLSALRFPFGKTVAICSIANGVSAGNPYLADFARRYSPNVDVIPTSIDLDRYPVQQWPKQDPFIISWSGSFSTLHHLEQARAAIEAVARKRVVIVKVICNKPPARPFAGTKTIFIPWKEDGEAEALGDAHVGIMPLPDTAFTRGKCALKALQYMAVGRPVVVSPVGVNSTIVRSNDNGFVVATTPDWIRSLEALADDHSLRTRLGLAARETVERHFSAKIVARAFAQFVKKSVSQERC